MKSEPDALRHARPSVRTVYAILTTDGPLMPRYIATLWEARSGEPQSVDTTNHALATLKRLGCAERLPEGWVALIPSEAVLWPQRFLLCR